MFELVGDSCKDYKEHKDQIQGCCSFAVNEAEALGEYVRITAACASGGHRYHGPGR